MRVKADMGIRQQKPEDVIDYPEATKASLGQTFLSWFRGSGSCQHCDLGTITSQFTTKLTPQLGCILWYFVTTAIANEFNNEDLACLIFRVRFISIDEYNLRTQVSSLISRNLRKRRAQNAGRMEEC